MFSHWLKLCGLGLLTASIIKTSLRLSAKRRDKSSIYFRCIEVGLGIAGRRSAPLNMMIKNKIPKKAPWGVDPGSDLLLEVAPSAWIYQKDKR